jgi:NADPH:quinone reductase-like Zn-dependent oxidoreductase
MSQILSTPVPAAGTPRGSDLTRGATAAERVAPPPASTPTMRAAVCTRFGPPEVVHLVVAERPTPRSGEVLVRVHAAVVTPSDAVARTGRPRWARPMFGLRAPRHPVFGTELAGVVEEVGAGVTGLQVGDRVVAATGTDFGAHAEYFRLAQDGALSLIPEGISCAEAVSLCEAGLTALPFMRDQARIRPGQRVLVNGASGSVGSAAVQLAKHFGAHVTGVCGTTNLELVRSLGADEVIDHTQQDFTADGRTYDVILDAVGKSSFRKCRRCLTAEGVYLTTVPSAAILPQMGWTRLRGGRRARIAFTGLRPPAAKSRDLAALWQIAADGGIRAVIGHRFAFDDIVAAYRLVDSGHKVGSAVLLLNPPPEPRPAPARRG